ncbi:hypothetical protein LINPERPRIM_LOCUS25468 [Linum perenne]
MDGRKLRGAFNFSKQRINQEKGLRGDDTIHAGFTTDFRYRLDPLALNTYFGNCIYELDVVLSVGDAYSVNGMAWRIAETVEDLERGMIVAAKKRLAKVLFLEWDQFVFGVVGSLWFPFSRMHLQQHQKLNQPFFFFVSFSIPCFLNLGNLASSLPPTSLLPPLPKHS